MEVLSVAVLTEMIMFRTASPHVSALSAVSAVSPELQVTLLSRPSDRMDQIVGCGPTVKHSLRVTCTYLLCLFSGTS